MPAWAVGWYLGLSFLWTCARLGCELCTGTALNSAARRCMERNTERKNGKQFSFGRRFALVVQVIQRHPARGSFATCSWFGATCAAAALKPWSAYNFGSPAPSLWPCDQRCWLSSCNLRMGLEKHHIHPSQTCTELAQTCRDLRALALGIVASCRVFSFLALSGSSGWQLESPSRRCNMDPPALGCTPLHTAHIPSGPHFTTSPCCRSPTYIP